MEKNTDPKIMCDYTYLHGNCKMKCTLHNCENLAEFAYVYEGYITPKLLCFYCETHRANLNILSSNIKEYTMSQYAKMQKVKILK